MDFSSDFFYALLYSLIAVAGGLIAGWLLERFLLRRLSKNFEIFRSLNGAGVFMGLLFGLRFALRYHDLPDSWHQPISDTWRAIYILGVTFYLARLVGNFIAVKMSDLNGLVPTATLLQNVARGVVYISGLMVLLQTLGISIAPALTALGVGGLAVALALQGTLGNLFSGIQIIASRKIQPGHFIRLESGEEGYVTDITWRNTTIRALSNQTIILPNSKLAESTVTNTWIPDPAISVLVPVGIHYDSDLEHVERVALEVANAIQSSHPCALHEHEPTLRYFEFADSSINFKVALRAVEFSEQFALRHDFIKALHARFKKEGITIPYPIRTLEFEKSSPLSLRNSEKAQQNGG
ncbi:MAG: mechanosensitive ion channel family protein [Lewinellaceae bacterium]|nr:mechanosensitive ion channel family protein [Saprospiraceae bacterium]MCB9305976.1 mechanosensitive ion channel family protein [Lewinellaceae bacterium]MCB9356320.1 mechanosensitive ion channel family protein [Lewinellaceae bacterium]